MRSRRLRKDVWNTQPAAWRRFIAQKIRRFLTWKGYACQVFTVNETRKRRFPEYAVVPVNFFDYKNEAVPAFPHAHPLGHRDPPKDLGCHSGRRLHLPSLRRTNCHFGWFKRTKGRPRSHRKENLGRGMLLFGGGTL